MAERTKRVIIGGVSGGVTGLIMEFLRGNSYMDGVSVATKVVFTGIIACVLYAMIIAVVKIVRPDGVYEA